MTATRTSPFDGPTTLYRLFDGEGWLLYVGISSRPALRFHEHAMTQPWWDLAETATFEVYPSRREALAAELQAIVEEQPFYNVAGNARNPLRREAEWDAAEPALQCRGGARGEPLALADLLMTIRAPEPC